MAVPDFSKRSTQFVVKWFSKLHIGAYRLLGGRVVGAGGTIMLLTTVGRKSGVERTKPLMFGADGDDLVVVASRAGTPEHPLWYKNLVKTPTVTVEVMGSGPEQRIARTATADEKARLWPMMVELYKDFAAYQERTDRDIPVVILSRP